jgi:hypothetical protein
MYIILVFLIKIVFIVLALTYIYLKTKGKEKTTLAKSVKYWKERVEFLFVFFMSLLLIYLFSPRSNRTSLIDRETKLLFYLFGFVLLITAKWENFFKESKWAVYLQNALGNRND